MTIHPTRSRHRRSTVECSECPGAAAKTGTLPEFPCIPHFHAVTGQDPYPWQRRLFRRFLTGEVPEAVDIPTGLGKTTSVLLALLARLVNPDLPRRVVHVVDRRALVDQAAETVQGWIERIEALPELACAFERLAAFPGPRPVGLGVLRGGLADDGEWRVDPARPAVIVGTVDMVGSRLLFRGYGCGRSRRAMDAGLLGHDTLLVLDEAHLAPAMGEVLRALARFRAGPAFRVMTLSAVRSEGDAVSPTSGSVLDLTPEDFADKAVRRRLDAGKTARFHEVAQPKDRIGTMCEAASAHRTGAMAVFARRVADARAIGARLARAHGGERVAVLTGTLRGYERSALVAGAVWRRFAPGRNRALTRELPAAYLVTTSAGEVGVDLDADQAVMDLVTLDSMIQRLGRVVRAGLGSATVTVVYTAHESAPVETPANRSGKVRAARRETLEMLRSLPDLSPGTLGRLDPAMLDRCCVSRVTPARLDRAVVESYALTSAELDLPPVGVYLKGVAAEPDVPETWLAWRRDIPDLARAGPEAAEAALAFFRPRPAEVARVPVTTAEKVVVRAMVRQEKKGLPLVVVAGDGEVHAAVVRDAAELPSLGFSTVLLPSAAGGLASSGIPDPDAAGAVSDVGDTADRIRYLDSESGESDLDRRMRPGWLGDAAQLRIPVPDDEDGLEVRCWVYALRRPEPDLATGAGEVTWVGGATQTLEEHGRRVGAAVRRIGRALELPRPLIDALVLAGEWHDAGKSRRVWQLAAGVPAGAPPLAKSRKGRFRSGWLGGYRHEFGSVADAERSLPADTPYRDLILHLVAAHHGWARPGFPRPEQWDPESPADANRALGLRIADRYARLSAEHGTGRLAWLESLLKSADAWVSSGRDR